MEKKWKILWIVVLTSFMSALDVSITNVAMPAIGESLKASFQLIALVPLFYLMSLALFVIPFGRLADIHGRKYFYITGVGVFTLGSILCGAAPTIHALISFRFLQGIGAALIQASAIAIVTEIFPTNERGKAIGITIASVYTGLTAGPMIGGLILQALSWRYIFYVNIPIGILALIGSFIYIEHVREEEDKGKFSWLGSAGLIIFLFSLLAGMQFFTPALTVALAAFGLTILISTEGWSSNPLIRLRHLGRNKMFIASNLTAFLNYIGIFTVSFLMSFYFIVVRELNPLFAGMMLGIMPLTQAVLSPFSGKMSDRIGGRTLCSFGMLLITLGLVLLAYVSIQSSLAWIGFCLLMTGFGMGLFSSPNTSAVMGSVEKHHLGIASSFLATMRLLGQSVSIIIMTVIMAKFVPTDLLSQIVAGIAQNATTAKIEFMMGLHYSFLILAVFPLIGIFTSLARGKRKVIT